MHGHLNVFLVFTASIALMWSQPAAGIGYEPDREKYRQALRDVVEFSCKEFARYGITIGPSRLNFGDQEVVDSFLKGREYYRDSPGNEVPLEPKLAWLAELFGDRYAEYEARWRRKVSESKTHPAWTLSKADISERLDALKSLGPSPVKMDSGMCRSSSGFVAVDMDCIHCGRTVVYCELDEIDHGKPPAYYKKVAEELGHHGIKVEVDGRAACPKCCLYPCDFKLGEFVRKVRSEDDVNCTNVIIQASKLRDIPPTFFIINGNRFSVSEYKAQLLLAFAKGYSTFYAGVFHDHYAVAKSEQWLRKVLLGTSFAPAPHVNGVPGSEEDGSRMRWEIDHEWYFKSFLPDIQADLEKTDPDAKDLTVAIASTSESELPHNGPVAGFAGAVKWNIFGATPEKWDVDMEYGICLIWGNAPCRHYVVLVTSLENDDNARCRIYETTGSDTYGFRKKVSELDCEDKTFSAIGEFWAKDRKGADVLVITPWLRRGTAQYVYTRCLSPMCCQ